LIGAALHQKTGIPWLADFRDPMAQPGYPADPVTWQQFRNIEATAAERARFCIFTTPGAAADYRARYPAAAQRTVVVENGYDEESFRAENLGQVRPAAMPLRPTAQVVMLHSGIVYPSERDPTQLFMALRRLAMAGLLSPAELKIRFRASVHDELLRSLARSHDVEDFIELCTPIPYREALAEMMAVDGLLVMQASNCNAQVPAKIYEYLRANKPILALTDPAGDTATVLRSAGLHAIVRLDSVDEIVAALPSLVRSWRDQTAALPTAAAVQGASRHGRARQLAALLDQTALESEN
jgi:glycosyltransferase involved in cell wall biosynthesis